MNDRNQDKRKPRRAEWPAFAVLGAISLTVWAVFTFSSGQIHL